MAIHEHAHSFAGLPVRVFDPAIGITDPLSVVYRLAVDYDADLSFLTLLQRFLDDPRAGQVPALVIGAWHGDDSSASSQPVVAALVRARDRLTRLRALFLGDIISEENEISWIQQSRVTPLLEAYPGLEEFRVRGGNELQIDRFEHHRLARLIVESGGLDAAVVRGIAASDLPLLEHLELWLGTEEYGGTATIHDLDPILNGSDRLPRLRYLGLRDAQGADELAASIAHAPILDQLTTLDLSLGDLGDAGLLALAASPRVAKLPRLDIHHHYATDDAVAKIKRLGLIVDASDPQTPDIWDGEAHRYIAVSE